jgi:hypothetical protein
MGPLNSLQSHIEILPTLPVCWPALEPTNTQLTPQKFSLRYMGFEYEVDHLHPHSTSLKNVWRGTFIQFSPCCSARPKRIILPWTCSCHSCHHYWSLFCGSGVQVVWYYYCASAPSLHSYQGGGSGIGGVGNKVVPSKRDPWCQKLDWASDISCRWQQVSAKSLDPWTILNNQKTATSYCVEDGVRTSQVSLLFCCGGNWPFVSSLIRLVWR